MPVFMHYLPAMPRLKRLLLATCLLGFSSLLQAAPEHPAAAPAGHHHEMMPQAVTDPALGIDEQLGAKIPLDITFRDEAGRPVKLRELVTGPTIILPVYYSCTNVCNFLQSGLAQVLPALKPKAGSEYRVISVSFDETETPELAARYKKTYLAAINAPFPEDGWRFLTGDSVAIHRLTDAAGYHFQRKGRDFIHPVVSLVVAGDGTIVRYLYGTTFLPKDLTLALLEAHDGKVGSTIRKVVGYCFAFDPSGKTYTFRLLRISATVVILSAGGLLAFLLLSSSKQKRNRPRNS